MHKSHNNDWGEHGSKMQGMGVRMSAFMPENPNFSRSIKISETAKGIRLDVHVWANTTAEAIDECFQMYLLARIKATENRIQLAPVEEFKRKEGRKLINFLIIKK